jgi:hypothetical protein
MPVNPYIKLKGSKPLKTVEEGGRKMGRGFGGCGGNGSVVVIIVIIILLLFFFEDDVITN